MEEKNTPENKQSDKKSWLEEQLQKRTIDQSEDTFSFKEDSDTHTEVKITQYEPVETSNIDKNTSSHNEVKTTETITKKAEKKGTTQEDMNAEKPSKWFQKFSQIGQKKLWGDITVKKAVPYAFGGVILVFLLFNIKYVIFNENKVPTLHNVNVKDTVLSDIPITKTLDPGNPDKNDTKSKKKQEKNSNDKEKKENTQNKQTTENNRMYYKVKSGDKFNDIARKHGLTPAELKELNPNVRPERIQPGQKLRVKKLD